MAAFVESTQLVRQVCQLLPLTRAGRAALPSGKASQRQLLLALAKLARAALVGPAATASVGGDCAAKQHLDAYMGHMNTMGRMMMQRQQLQPDGPALPLALLAYHNMRHAALPGDHLGAILKGRSLVERLREARFAQAVDREMQQLADGGSEERPLFAARQLEYSSCCIVAESNIVLQMR